MRARRRRNPTPVGSRISVKDAVAAWPELGTQFRYAASVGALTLAGFLPGDEDAERAIAAPDGRPKGGPSLAAMLQRCGTPECKLARLARGSAKSYAAAERALIKVAPAVLPWLQAALFAAWGESRYATDLLRLLTTADRRAGVWAACQVARTTLPLVPAGESRPRRAIETAEAWTRGAATLAQVRGTAADAYDAYDATAAYYAAAAASPAPAFRDAAAAAAAAYYAAAAAAAADRRSAPQFDAALAQLADVVRASAQCPELVP